MSTNGELPMNEIVTVEPRVFTVVNFDFAPMIQAELRTLERLQPFVISNSEDCQFVADLVLKKKKLLKDLEASRDDHVRPFNDAVKQMNAAFKGLTSVLERIEDVGKKSLAAWERQERVRVQEAQRIADEAAAAERKRLADEAAALAAKARVVEAQAQATPDTPQADAAIQQAQEFRAASFALQSEVLTTRAAPVLAAKIKGTSVRENWQVELVDKAALLKYLTEHPEYLDFVDLNQTAAKAVVKVQKGNCQIPGLRVWDAGTVSMRAA
jgi:hypothetical protein